MKKIESRRNFLKKTAYAAPVVLALGGLSAHAHSRSSKISSGESHENNGHGNGDQEAPGNSGSHNNAENSKKGGKR